MKILVKTLYILFSVVFLLYLSLPGYDYPLPPPDSLQSQEPADTETPERRAYFTDYDREKVLNHYQEQFKKSSFMNLPIPTYRLNYPPEEAKNLIRDQTRSTFLEEITHPLRESFFVNGFQAKDEKDTIFISGKKWLLKITTRLVKSSTFSRIVVGVSILVILPLLFKSWSSTFFSLKKEVLRKWNFQ